MSVAAVAIRDSLISLAARTRSELTRSIHPAAALSSLIGGVDDASRNIAMLGERFSPAGRYVDDALDQLRRAASPESFLTGMADNQVRRAADLLDRGNVAFTMAMVPVR